MSKTLKQLHKHYAHLGALERYKLFARAMERDDEVESKRLFDACPYEEDHYRVRDKNFIRFYERSQFLCTVFSVCFTETMYQVMLLTLQLDCYASLDIAHLRAFVIGFLEAYDRLFKEELDANTIVNELMDAFKNYSMGIGEPDRWKEECDNVKKQVSDLKAIYGAMRKFCDEMGLEIDDILCWNPTIKRDITLAKGYLETPIEADETILNVLHESFRSAWIGKAKESLDPYIEEEIEGYWREVKQDIEGYDSIDIYTSDDGLK